MPGATSLGIPYPYQYETVDASSWLDLATAVDGLMTSLDAIRALAADRPSAGISGGAANAVASATTTTVTNFTFENWDTGGYADLGVSPNQLTVPPGLYFVSAAGLFGSVTTFTMARITILAGGVTWAGSMIDANVNLGSTLSSTAGVVLATAATTAIQVQVRWQGVGGPPNFDFVQLQAMQIRALANV